MSHHTAREDDLNNAISALKNMPNESGPAMRHVGTAVNVPEGKIKTYTPYTKPASMGIGIATKLTVTPSAPEAPFVSNLNDAIGGVLIMRNRLRLLCINLVGEIDDLPDAPEIISKLDGPIIPTAIQCAQFIKAMMNDCEVFMKEINKHMPGNLQV